MYIHLQQLLFGYFIPTLKQVGLTTPPRDKVVILGERNAKFLLIVSFGEVHSTHSWNFKFKIMFQIYSTFSDMNYRHDYHCYDIYIFKCSSQYFSLIQDFSSWFCLDYPWMQCSCVCEGGRCWNIHYQVNIWSQNFK